MPHSLRASAPATGAPDAKLARLEELLHNLYRSVSGPAGPRDWTYGGEQYAPNARICIVHSLPSGGREVEYLSVPEYRQSRERYFANHAFYEEQVRREIDVRGNMAHVFSVFACRRSPDAKPFATGSNSIQLVFSADRWWITSIMWESTTIAAQLRTPNTFRLGR